jgi:tricorn protease
MDGDGGSQRNLFRHWDKPDFTFSPDGRWLAYSRQDDDYNSDIFIAAVNPDDPDLPPCPLEGWERFPGHSRARALVPSWADGEVNITRHPDDDYKPVWSPDGGKLGFTSVRYFDNVDAYFVFLKQADEERSIGAWELQSEPLPALPEPPKSTYEDEPVEEGQTDEQAEEEKPFRVEIDFDQIHRRAHRIASHPGTEYFCAFSPDGKTIVFSSDTDGSADLWQIDWTGKDEKALTNNASPDQVIWHVDADRIFYLSGGRVLSNKSGGGDSMTHEFIARMIIDPLQERMYKFNEAWRIENVGYYDENFHGQNWDALRTEYEPLAAASRHYRDFNDTINLMFGRLNSSHLSYSDAGSGPSGLETGYLGCGLSEDDRIGLLVGWVTPRSPVDHVEIGIQPGDRIVSINGTDVGGWGDSPVGDWSRALEDTPGREIEIGVIDSDGETGDPRWVRLTPISYWEWYDLAYEAWMADNRGIVDDLSGGRLGYLHVRSMSEGPLERFEQDLYTVGHGKDGIIIDVRWNSGGWTTDYLLAMLNTRRHALT